jgi:hypothetical protein
MVGRMRGRLQPETIFGALRHRNDGLCRLPGLDPCPLVSTGWKKWAAPTAFRPSGAAPPKVHECRAKTGRYSAACLGCLFGLRKKVA